ncbi:hypothetical protein GCM10009530_14900 [Microbispora corallina]|uniref:Uncharacterized protein n=1 Tax=Microbispora corallina TaxID=83302 RepID=A0ABQ4FXB9_9ACTN|nr:hypothetical protein [Microbispora corallina]GIH39448.1 hypothetical protein Mco01_24480 [Microbispora corallina]
MRESVDLLAALADDVQAAALRDARRAYAILDEVERVSSSPVDVHFIGLIGAVRW